MSCTHNPEDDPHTAAYVRKHAPITRPDATGSEETPEWATAAAMEHYAPAGPKSHEVVALANLILKHAPSQPRQAGLEGLREVAEEISREARKWAGISPESVMAIFSKHTTPPAQESQTQGMREALAAALAELTFWQEHNRESDTPMIGPGQNILKTISIVRKALTTPPPVAEPVATEQAVEKCAEEILAGSEHDAIRWYGPDKDGVFCWQYRTKADIKAIILGHLTPGSALGAAREETGLAFECGNLANYWEKTEAHWEGVAKNATLKETKTIAGERADVFRSCAKALRAHMKSTPTPPRSLAGDGATDEQFEAAIKKAVEVGLVPRYDYIDVAAGNRDKIKQVVRAAMQPRSEPGATGEREG